MSENGDTPTRRVVRGVTEAADLITLLEEWAKDTGGDFGVRLQIASRCLWSCEVRLTPDPNRLTESDRSYVAYAVGGEKPFDVLQRATVDAFGWIADMEEAELET